MAGMPSGNSLAYQGGQHSRYPAYEDINRLNFSSSMQASPMKKRIEKNTSKANKNIRLIDPEK